MMETPPEGSAKDAERQRIRALDEQIGEMRKLVMRARAAQGGACARRTAHTARAGVSGRCVASAGAEQLVGLDWLGFWFGARRVYRLRLCVSDPARAATPWRDADASARRDRCLARGCRSSASGAQL